MALGAYGLGPVGLGVYVTHEAPLLLDELFYPLGGVPLGHVLGVYIAPEVGGNSVAATKQSIVFNGYSTTVNVATAVTSSKQSLAVNEYSTSIFIGNNLNVVVPKVDVVISPKNTNVSVGSNLSLNTTSVNLGLTAYDSTVFAGTNADIVVTNTTLNVSSYNASVSVGSNLNLTASKQALSVTEYNAAVSGSLAVQATKQSLTFTEYSSTVLVSLTGTEAILQAILVAIKALPTAEENANAFWTHASRTLTEQVGLTPEESAKLLSLPTAVDNKNELLGTTEYP